MALRRRSTAFFEQSTSRLKIKVGDDQSIQFGHNEMVLSKGLYKSWQIMVLLVLISDPKVEETK